MAGGGILNDGTLTLTDDVISNNEVFDSGNDIAKGAGIYNDGTLSINTSTITGNTAFANSSADAEGGGIANDGTLTITGSTISGNTATNGNSTTSLGGGIASGGTLTLIDSTIADNVASSGGSGSEADGGGIDGSNGAVVNLTNCTITGNSLQGVKFSGGPLANGFGGGVSGSSATITLTNCTVAGNTAVTAGGGIDATGQGSLTLNLTNTIVATNTVAAGGTNADINGSVASANHNLIGDGTSSGVNNGTNGNQVGTTANPINPQLGPLSNNGGTTQTMPLESRSPAIDAGDNAAVANPPFPGPPFTDQRGTDFPRIVNGAVDIGAFEFSPIPSLVVTTAADDIDGGTLADADGPDGTLSLREAITLANLEGGGIITFDIPGLSAQAPQTITLTSALPALNAAITISGPGANELTVSGDDKFQVFSVPSGSIVSITGLTIAHGFNNVAALNGGVLPFVAGGGIYNAGTLALTSDVLTNNAATNTANNGFAAGGAVYNFGTLTVDACAFNNNSVSATTGNTSGAAGGAIDSASFDFNHPAGLTITDSTLNGNSASDPASGSTGGQGGALGISGAGSVTITASAISGNTASGGVGEGGGVYDATYSDFAVNIIDSTISGNEATASLVGGLAEGGGIYEFGNGPLSLTNCTIANNTVTSAARGVGGGFADFDSIATLTNCTVTGNADNFTDVGSAPVSGGGGIWDSGTFGMTNTIVAGNTETPGGTGADFSNNQSSGDVVSPDDHNLIGIGDGSGLTNGTHGDQVGSAASPFDAKLGTLGNNGGPTNTIALLAGSPAIDAGDNAAVTNLPFPGPPFTDQRGTGFSRIVNSTVDIGAFELQPEAPGQVQFSAATFHANETDPSAAITLTRTGGTSGAISVTVGVSGGTAIDGTDYNFTSQVVNWADGDITNKTVNIPLIDDNATGESDETVNLSLSNAGGGATIGTQSTAMLTISEDNDVVTPGTITWTGGSTTDSNWSDPANWDLNRAPINGDSLVFPATAQRLTNSNDISGLSVNSVTFQGNFTTVTGGYTLRGDALAVGAGGVADNGTIPSGDTTSLLNQIDLNVTLAAAQSWSIDDNNNFHHLLVNGNLDNGGFALTTIGSGTIDLAGQISGSGSLTVNAGAAGNFLSVDLDQANTYSGGTQIINGFVDVSADGALGPGGTNDAGTTVGALGQLELHSVAYNTPEALTLDGILGNESGNSSFTGPITITGAPSGSGNGLPVAVDAQISDLGEGTFTLNGPTLVNNGHAALFIQGANLALGDSSVVAINNVISGPGGLLVAAAEVQLQAANTYQGATLLSGIAEVDAGVDNAIPSTSGVMLQAAAGNSNLLKLAGHIDTIASLAGTESGGGTNTVDLGTNGVLSTGDSTSTNFAGDITGTGALIKQGSGAFDLTGANDYTGTTTVAAGTLIVDGSTAAGNDFKVTDATLGGVGTIGGTIAVTAGTVDPGAGPAPSNVTGTLSNTGGVSFALFLSPPSVVTLATFDVELGGTAANPTHDQLTSAGTVSLNGVNLNLTTLTGAGPFNPGQQFVIIQAGAPISGTFNNLSEGSIVKAGGQSFSISYANDKVTLATLPALVVTTADDENDGGTLADPLGADGKLSLREAIELANLYGGPQTISFAIPGSGVQTIHVGSTSLGSLPSITVPVTMDGYTQPGASANTLAKGDNAVILIALDGDAIDGQGNDVSGIQLTGGNSTVRGLAIGNFGTSNAGAEGQSGISISGAGGNTIAGNFIGTDATGKTAAANFTAVEIVGTSNDTIGGTAPADRNILSGNGPGGGVSIRVAADKTPAGGNVVEGNFIGLDVTGKTALDNSGTGVDIVGASGNTIGGTAAGAGNVISGNDGAGVGIEADLSSITVGNQSGATGLEAQNNLVEGNLIGTDVSGSAAIGNGNVDGALFIIGQPGSNDNNIIGGTTAAARNVISGNGYSGIELSGDGNLIEGNYIGPDVTGTKLLSLTGAPFPVGNGANGIYIDGGSNNTIGGTAPGAANVISGNGDPTQSSGDGILIEPFYSTVAGQAEIHSATGNLIEGNLIGADATGQKTLGNIGGGVVLHGVSGNQVGGTSAAAANVISANGAVGVGVLSDNISDGLGDLKRFDAKNNLIEGNFIGTDRSGTVQLGNGTAGVAIASSAASAANNAIGGTAASAGNIIAFNKQQGVVVGHAANENATTGNSIEGNLIFGNGGLGIDLGDDGVTQNTPGGPHAGPNDLQNFPVITSATPPQPG